MPITNITATNLRKISGTSLTGRDWSSDFANLDIALSALRDALRGANTKDFSTLEADAESILGQLDITLSSLRDALRGTGTKDFTTLESDIEDIRNALSSIGTDKLLTTPDNPSNLDVALSTRATESTLSSVLGQLDITLSALRDALRGASNKDFTTLEADIESILSQLDITLSNLRDTLDSRLYNTTDALSVYDHLKQIRTQIDSYLANLDIALSALKATGTETPRTLSNLYDQLTSILNQLDITLSAVRDAAYDSVNDRKKISIENDAVGLAKSSDISATQPRNLTQIAGTALTGRDWSNDFAKLDIALSSLRDALRGANTKDFSTLEADAESILGQLDITLSALRDALIDVTLDNLIHNNATVNSTGQSDSLAVKGAKHIDVLIRVGSMTGSPTIQFHVDVIEPTSGAVIRTYDGTSISAADTSDWITVDGLTLGTHVKVRWDGTLDTSNYFSGVFCRIVAKR